LQAEVDPVGVTGIEIGEQRLEVRGRENCTDERNTPRGERKRSELHMKRIFASFDWL
jgi:hypothetical protein